MKQLRPSRNRLVAVIAAFLVVSTSLMDTFHSAAAPSRRAERPIDLAAVVLTPADLAAEGLAGYGSDYGERRTMEQIAIGFAAQEDRPLDEAIELYEELGLVQSYTVRIAEPAEPGDFNGVATATVAFTLVEYEDAAGAELAFNLAEADAESAGSLEDGAGEMVGDGSFLARRDGEDESGDAYAELAIDFHVDRFHGSIDVADVATSGESGTPAAPDVALAESLGARQVERIEDGLANETASLGLSAIRLMTDEAVVVTLGDRYNAVDGAPLPRFAETQDELDARAAQLEAEEMTTVYSLEQDVRADAGDNDPRAPHLAVRLIQFSDADAAGAWFETDAYESFAGDPYLDSIEPIDTSMYQDEPQLAAAYTAHYGGTEIEGLVMWVLVDDIVARVSLDAAGGVSPMPLTKFMTEQIACLEAGACASPVTVPNSLLP